MGLDSESVPRDQVGHATLSKELFLLGILTNLIDIGGKITFS